MCVLGMAGESRDKTDQLKDFKNENGHVKMGIISSTFIVTERALNDG